MAAAVHRGWIAIKDAVTGSSPSAQLKAAIHGESHAIERYQCFVAVDFTPESLVELPPEEIRLARAELIELEQAQD